MTVATCSTTKVVNSAPTTAASPPAALVVRPSIRRQIHTVPVRTTGASVTTTSNLAGVAGR